MSDMHATGTRVHAHDWVVSPNHEVVICQDCGAERIECLLKPPALTVQIHGSFAGLPWDLQPRGGRYVGY